MSTEKRQWFVSWRTIPDNTNVGIASGDKPVHGTVVSTAGAPTSYMVEMPSGKERHNQQHINTVPENKEQAEQSKTQSRDLIMAHSRTGAPIPLNQL